MPRTSTRSMRCLWGYNALRGGFSLGARGRYHFPDLPPFLAIWCPVNRMFSPRHSPAHRLFPGGRSSKNQQRCAQGVPPNRRGDRRHCIAPATLRCIRPVGVCVSKLPAIRSARASLCALVSCFASSRETSSLLAQSSPLETSRSSRRVRKRIKSHQTETVVANSDSTGEGDNLRKGMGACLLFCR